MNRAALQDTPLQEIKINCPGDVIYLLVDTINQVRAGSMDARIANCLGVLSSHLLRAMEHGEMQESLARIEEYIQQTA